MSLSWRSFFHEKKMEIHSLLYWLKKPEHLLNFEYFSEKYLSYKNVIFLKFKNARFLMRIDPFYKVDIKSLSLLCGCDITLVEIFSTGQRYFRKAPELFLAWDFAKLKKTPAAKTGPAGLPWKYNRHLETRQRKIN